MKATLWMLGGLTALWLYAHGGTGLLLAAVIVAAMMLLRGHGAKARRVFPITGHGHGARHARRHENGHRRVAEALSCRTRFRYDEHGVPVATEILSGPPLTPAEHAAIAYGGRMAAGPAGCEGDDRIAEQHLSAVPWSQRGTARREARRIARRLAR